MTRAFAEAIVASAKKYHTKKLLLGCKVGHRTYFCKNFQSMCSETTSEIASKQQIKWLPIYYHMLLVFDYSLVGRLVLI